MAKTMKKAKRASPPKSTKPVPKNTARKPQPPPPPEPPPVQVTVRTVYHDGQHLPALCFRHPTGEVQAVTGNPIEGVRDIPLSTRDHDRSDVVFYLGAPFPPLRFANHMKIHVLNGRPITPAARALLLPLAPDMPAYTPPDAPPPAPGEPQAFRVVPIRAGAARTSGKDLIKELAARAKLPPEKVRAKLRGSGLKAPYTDADACFKALGVKR